MTVKIVGIKNEKFTINDEIIEGQKYFYTYKYKNVIGEGTGSVFERNGNRNVNDLIEVRWSKNYKKFYVKK